MAPPKKWEDDSESEEETSSGEESVDLKTVNVPIRKKFDDEEDSDDVADNWDEAEDSEEERKKASAAAAAKAKADEEAAKNKKSKAQRVEEHREANRRKKMAEMDDEESEEEDEATRRERLRATEKEADMKHAEDLLAAGLGQSKKGAKAIVVESQDKPGEAIDLSSIPLFKPATKTQFEALSEVLVPLLRNSSNKPHYSIWMQNFVKQICQDMPSAEIKKAASTLTALSNEKMAKEKMADKTGKKTKAQQTKTKLAGVSRGGATDTTAYEDGLADDDFM
ncbi:Translation initiation factor 3 subunit J component [Lithohypha guttulata]|uniref:Eukaryotic translation initiation factor 3 subunit J n=1 Tax=Lithohypha guttulata TaxID=1690604 RepID=A0AAN7T802_9EURO|nr:Translation initiation factor 3 subunit J component [Lithohypha guttulata]KAK5090621.1 Translation initiation factor 3 subunit J component [Lithohypha guttulata]